MSLRQGIPELVRVLMSTLKAAFIASMVIIYSVVMVRREWRTFKGFSRAAGIKGSISIHKLVKASSCLTYAVFSVLLFSTTAGVALLALSPGPAKITRNFERGLVM